MRTASTRPRSRWTVGPVTPGMLTEEQAKRLEKAGLHAYNHNIDTSEEYYEDVISTRTYDDRLNTISNVRKTNITVCSGEPACFELPRDSVRERRKI